MKWITKNISKVFEKITKKNGEASASPCKKIIDVFPEEIEKNFEKLLHNYFSCAIIQLKFNNSR